MLEDLTCGDLSIGEFLHGRQTFDLLAEIAEKVAPQASFLDLFWHLRAIYVPILRLLPAAAPPARCYHTVSTGYAGLCGAAFSLRTGRPLIVTEHGIYSRERNMDLARASWIKDQPAAADAILGGRQAVAAARALVAFVPRSVPAGVSARVADRHAERREPGAPDRGRRARLEDLDRAERRRRARRPTAAAAVPRRPDAPPASA